MIPSRAARSCTFRTTQRSSGWIVTRDHEFYGDYFSQGQAVAAACMGARAVEAKGASARVLDGPGETLVPHDAPSAKT